MFRDFMSVAFIGVRILLTWSEIFAESYNRYLKMKECNTMLDLLIFIHLLITARNYQLLHFYKIYKHNRIVSPSYHCSH